MDLCNTTEFCEHSGVCVSTWISSWLLDGSRVGTCDGVKLGWTNPKDVFGRGRGKGAAGGVAINFCNAVESAVKGVGFLGDPEPELAGGPAGAPARTGAFSEERREDVTRDLLSVPVRTYAAAATFEASAEFGGGGGAFDPTEAPVRSPVKDDVLRNPRFAANLVSGAFDLTPDNFILSLVRVLVLTRDGRGGACLGLEEAATGRGDIDKEEGLGRRERAGLEGMGMRDFEGEFCSRPEDAEDISGLAVGVNP